MFNQESIYAIRYIKKLEEDFVKTFPGLCDNISVTFTNDPISKTKTWADVCLLKATVGEVEVGKEEKRLFKVYLGKLYGQCGAATVSDMSVYSDYMHNGIGTWLMNWVKTMLAEMGFTIAIGTTKQDQDYMIKILLKTEWKEVKELSFVNRRTDNSIKFWKVDLPMVEKKIVPNVAHLGVII